MIKIKRGQTRIVLIIGNWFVIKLPIIYLRAGLNNAFGSIKRGHFISHEIKKYNYLISGSVKRYLLAGLINNWKEFRFYKKSKLPILMPTYFSFFGLFNIQKAGQPISIKSVDLWCQLYGLTNGRIFDDSHTFNDPTNFCIERGRLKIIDYGEEVHAVLTKYGYKIFNEFDFSYDWKIEKQKLKEAE